MSRHRGVVGYGHERLSAVHTSGFPDHATLSAPATLFLGGLGRSGTTIFELSMATDDRVASLGEVTHLWRRSLLDDESCGCGRPFSECSFWREVGEVAFGGWSNVDPHRVIDLKRRLDRSLQTPRLRLALGNAVWKTDVREYAAYYARVYRAAAVVSGCSVVVDSSKQASLPHLLRTDPTIDLRVLHCVRDSRAVAHSWTKRITRPEANGERHAFMVRYSPLQTAVKWLQHNLVVEGLRTCGVPIQRVRYEDWTDDPRAQVAKALEFGGLERRDNTCMGDDWVSLREAHTCSGNPARFRRGRTTIRLDEEWRSQLSLASRRIVTAITLPLLAAYGYLRETPLDRPTPSQQSGDRH